MDEPQRSHIRGDNMAQQQRMWLFCMSTWVWSPACQNNNNSKKHMKEASLKGPHVLGFALCCIIEKAKLEGQKMRLPEAKGRRDGEDL